MIAEFFANFSTISGTIAGIIFMVCMVFPYFEQYISVMGLMFVILYSTAYQWVFWTKIVPNNEYLKCQYN